MTYFILNNGAVRVMSGDSLNIVEELPVDTYSVRFSPDAGGFFLSTTSEFNIDHKIYGDVEQRHDRIMNTYFDRYEKDMSTGVLLSGEKGSGKTLLAKLISMKAMQNDIPTLIVNSSFSGESFATFISQIPGKCVVIFDEFEKVYNEKEDQEAILTLLDGLYTSPKLFILTCNDEYKINQNMINRPGRIFYSYHYRGLDDSFIEEYCKDTLKDQKHLDRIIEITRMVEGFNFDMLQSLVEEMNRYTESPGESIKHLNVKATDISYYLEFVELQVNGKAVNVLHLDDERYTLEIDMDDEYDDSFNATFFFEAEDKESLEKIYGHGFTKLNNFSHSLIQPSSDDDRRTMTRKQKEAKERGEEVLTLEDFGIKTDFLEKDDRVKVAIQFGSWKTSEIVKVNRKNVVFLEKKDVDGNVLTLVMKNRPPSYSKYLAF